MSIDISALAHVLDQAVLKRTAIDSLRTENPFDLAQAYEIQTYGLGLREDRGENLIGVKLGFTSRAKMQQMGVDHLIWGGLTDAMQLEDDGVVDLSRFIHPRIEPEVGFITKRAIDVPLSMATALQYIECIFPAMEIIDSRYNQFKFSLEDVVADNTSSAGFVMGNMCSPNTLIDNCGVQMRINGRTAQTGSTAAILGHPLRALVEVSHLLCAQNQSLPAGSVILAGAATAAEAMAAGAHYQSTIHGLGNVSIHAGV